MIATLDKSWIDDFWLDSFQLKTTKGADGVNFDSVKILEIMAGLQKDKTVGPRLQKKVKAALQILIEQAGAISSDPYSENRIFFVAPKNAKKSCFDLTALNLHVLNTIIESKKGLNLADIHFNEENFSLYRNYFESKATSALTLSTAFYALRGLKSQADQVFL